jgi:Lrp/AsnC family leucine-responsive transcriptional regulator
MALRIRNENPSNKTANELDDLDRRILRILQRDSLVSNQSLADQVGLSPPACLKRVRRLRVSGIIQHTVALLSPEALGYPLLTVARVKLDRPTEKAIGGFEARMATLPRVVQCFTVSGDIDFVVLIRSRDVAHYQEFARQVLATAPGIRSYTSEIVLAVNKATTELPIES